MTATFKISLMSLTKHAWSISGGYIKNQRRDKVGISPLEENGILATTGKQKAEYLSRQYEKVFTKEDVSFMPSKGDSPYPKMEDIIVDEEGVAKLLNGLNPKKAHRSWFTATNQTCQGKCHHPCTNPDRHIPAGSSLTLEVFWKTGPKPMWVMFSKNVNDLIQPTIHVDPFPWQASYAKF